MEKAKIPDWIKKVKKNTRSRERYFLKKYGNLSRMRAIDEKMQDWMDRESAKEEYQEHGI